MLITKYIKVEVNRGNKGSLLKHYNDLSIGDKVEIPSLLFKGSERKVEVQCDYCKEQIQVTVKNYVQATKKISKYSCSNSKCQVTKKQELIDLGINSPNKKRKASNLKKYGVEHLFQLDSIKNKSKKTKLKKYGVEHSLQNDKLKSKKDNTMLERYGVKDAMHSKEIKNTYKSSMVEKYGCESPFQAEEVKKKIEQTNLERHGVSFISQADFVKDKIKIGNIRKYGVPYSFQAEEVKNKVEKTNIERYGTKIPMRAEEVKLKFKNSMLKKYGVENPFKSEEIKNKAKETNLKKYGFAYAIQSEEIKDRIKKTNLKKYGTEYPSRNLLIKEKTKKTNLKRYGKSSILQTDEVRKKVEKSNIDKYGVKHVRQSEKYRKDNFGISNNPNYIEYNKDTKRNVFKCDKNKEHTFEINSTQYFDRNKGNIPLCTVCNPIGDSTSIKQQDLSDFIKEHTDLEVLDNYRGFGKEIDIYLPELNLGYEFNGLYWHSEKFRDKYYHQDKTNLFKKEGIKIVHIWEDEWDNKKDIIKSQIKNSLKLSKVIFARKTKCKEISKEESRKFLNENHLQGAYSRIKKTLGLFHKEELVSVMVFDHQEGRKNLSKDEWNLSRFCNKKNTTVVGGASKLLKTFLRNNSPKRIISYADADWSTGGLYENLGFTEVSRSRPDYKYVVEGKREHKSKWRKKKGQTKTEREIMQELGIERIYDCGKIKYEINTHKHNG